MWVVGSCCCCCCCCGCCCCCCCCCCWVERVLLSFLVVFHFSNVFLEETLILHFFRHVCLCHPTHPTRAMLIVLSHLHVGSTSGNILISRYIEFLLDIHQGICPIYSHFSSPSWPWFCSPSHEKANWVPGRKTSFCHKKGTSVWETLAFVGNRSQRWFLGQRFVRAWMMYQNDPKIMALLEYDPNYCFDRRYITRLFQPFSMICKRDKIDIHPARWDPGTPINSASPQRVVPAQCHPTPPKK